MSKPLFSDVMKSTLEGEVAGQPLAVNSVVRGATRLISGLTPGERPYCAYMLMGPPGTGKAHLVHALARFMHGDSRRVLVLDSNLDGHGNPGMSLATQLSALFPSRPRPGWPSPGPSPVSIVLGQRIDDGSAELHRALGRVLESGHVVLPEGRQERLRSCMVFLTSTLCSDEILEQPSRIGFTGPFEDDDENADRDKVYQHCREAAEEHFGSVLLGHLDGFIIFRRLEKEHLAAILERRFARMDEWMALRGFRCVMLPAAKEFLLRRGTRHLRHGARDLVVAHRKFVEFPVADLMISGGLPPGGTVRVDCNPGEEHLHFTVDAPDQVGATTPDGAAREIPILSP